MLQLIAIGSCAAHAKGMFDILPPACQMAMGEEMPTGHTEMEVETALTCLNYILHKASPNLNSIYEAVGQNCEASLTFPSCHLNTLPRTSSLITCMRQLPNSLFDVIRQKDET